MDLRPIEKLLTYGVFAIPDYQRGYSWGKEQLEEFWEDLEDSEYVKEHYTGTITIVKSSEERIGLKTFVKYDIVDGQQRLITMHIFLISLYFRLKELGKEKEEEDILSYVTFKGKTLLRLNSNENQRFFEEIILANDSSKLQNYEAENKTQNNILLCRKFFAKRFDRFGDRKSIKLFNNLLLKFKVNIFELEDEADVGLIFETMNDRGIPLSEIDKVKNYLIYYCHRLNDKLLVRETNRQFGEVFNILMNIQGDTNVVKVENQFLGLVYAVFKGETSYNSDVHRSIKNDLFPKKEVLRTPNLFDGGGGNARAKMNDIRDFNSYLIKSAKAYTQFIKRESRSIQVNHALNRIGYIGSIEPFLPLIIALEVNENMKNQHLLEILKLLEVFTMHVYFIGRRKSNTGRNDFYRLAHLVLKNKAGVNQIKQEIKALISKNITNSEVKEELIKSSIYGRSSDDKAIMFLLYEYEFERARENKTLPVLPELEEFLKSKQYTIEHIHPQTPQPGMTKLNYLHLIGNLVLTSNNKLLDNKEFAVKRKIYANSELVSERDIANYEKWDDKTIISRGKQIAKFALSRWRV